jgi:hypothetical protein
MHGGPRTTQPCMSSTLSVAYPRGYGTIATTTAATLFAPKITIVSSDCGRPRQSHRFLGSSIVHLLWSSRVGSENFGYGTIHFQFHNSTVMHPRQLSKQCSGYNIFRYLIVRSEVGLLVFTLSVFKHHCYFALHYVQVVLQEQSLNPFQSSTLNIIDLKRKRPMCGVAPSNCPFSLPGVGMLVVGCDEKGLLG